MFERFNPFFQQTYKFSAAGVGLPGLVKNASMAVNQVPKKDVVSGELGNLWVGRVARPSNDRHVARRLPVAGRTDPCARLSVGGPPESGTARAG